jgi:hypothetical protein
MPNFEQGGWVVEIDPVATASAYADQAPSYAERCGCVGCRNFIAVREEAFPAPVRCLLADFGIDYRKEADATQCAPPKGDLYPYSGWFNLAGKVLSDPGDMAVVSDRFKCFFIAGSSGVPVPAAQELLRLEFELLAPWSILEEPESWE